MRLQSLVIKPIALVTVVIFFSGCAGMFNSGGISTPTMSGLNPAPPKTIIVEAEPAKPMVKAYLKKGQPAPADGIWFDQESAKVILGDLAEFRGLKAKVQIQEQIIDAYTEQAGLLKEANDLQAQANQELRKEIESKRKWDAVKNWASVLGAVAAFGLGIWAGK
jgi:hypothetical protein